MWLESHLEVAVVVGGVVLVVVVVVGKRAVEFYMATRNRCSFLLVLSVNTRANVEVGD